MPHKPVALPPPYETRRKKRWARRVRTARRIVFPSMLSLLLGATLWMAIAPDFGTGTYAVNGQDPVRFTLPLRIPGDPQGNFEIRFPMRLGFLHPGSYLFVTDDCLQSVEVNGQPVTGAALPFCDYGRYKVLHLGEYLHAGENTVTVRSTNAGGGAGLIVQTAPHDPLVIGLMALLGMVILWAVSAAMRPVRGASDDIGILALAVGGIAFRFVYMLLTPVPLRGHDTDGHIEYIQYLVDNWALPPPNAGWEYWQPPLYYAVSALWYELGILLSWSSGAMLFGVQVQSLLLSLVILAAGMWIAFAAFPGNANRPERLHYTAIMAAFPGLLYLVAFINNDVLETALAFVFLAMLFAWWKRPHSHPLWYGMAVMAALAVMTKSNGLLLLPIALLLLAIRGEIRWKERMLHGLAAVLIVASASAVLSTRTDTSSVQRYMVGNIVSLNGPLAIPNDVESYVTFNPAGMLQYPYANPWDDGARRKYFWEYLFRSAFFGEWNFGEPLKILCMWILMFALMLLPAGLWGMVDAVRRRLPDALPFFASLAVFAAGHMAFRWISPFSTSQDFRYSTAMLVPAAYFIVYGISRLPTLPRHIATGLLQSSVVLWVILLLSV